MSFFDYIGEFFLFRWLFGRERKNGRQEMSEMSEMSAPYRDNGEMGIDRYCDMDEADCLGYEDFLDEQEDYDMIDDDY